jgi:hypothetical protein
MELEITQQDNHLAKKAIVVSAIENKSVSEANQEFNNEELEDISAIGACQGQPPLFLWKKQNGVYNGNKSNKQQALIPGIATSSNTCKRSATRGMPPLPTQLLPREKLTHLESH